MKFNRKLLHSSGLQYTGTTTRISSFFFAHEAKGQSSLQAYDMVSLANAYRVYVWLHVALCTLRLNGVAGEELRTGNSGKP